MNDLQRVLDTAVIDLQMWLDAVQWQWIERITRQTEIPAGIRLALGDRVVDVARVLVVQDHLGAGQRRIAAHQSTTHAVRFCRDRRDDQCQCETTNDDDGGHCDGLGGGE